MASWASESVKVLLRVALTVLLVILGLELGIRLAPRLARFGASRPTPATRNSPQPDWGGGRLSFPARTPAGIVDSIEAASSGEVRNPKPQVQNPMTQTWSSPGGGVVLRQKPGGDHALTLALPAPGQPGRSGVFEVPSSGHFREELFPGTEDVEAPAVDIPVYPLSSCRMQVGKGTACFAGFYLTPDSIEAVRSFYVRVLGQLGWQRVTAGDSPQRDSPRLLETFAKRDEDRTVVVQLRKQDSATTRIGLVAMGSGLRVAGYGKERK
jgi:hypothetical protein